MKKLLRKTAVSLAAVTALFIVPCGMVSAATVHVNAAASSGIYDGSAENPFTSIQQGINAASAGDLVTVAPGTYYECVSLKNGVNVASEQGPEVTIIDGMGGYVLGTYFDPQGSIVSSAEGFTVTNGSYLVVGVSFWGSYNRITLKNCIIRNGSTGVRASIMSQFTLENVVISNTVQAIAAIWGASPVLRNVTIDTADQGLWVYQTGVNLTNTSLTNTSLAMWAPYSGSVWGSHNNFFGYETLASGNLYTDLTDSVSVDPLFVSAPVDYRLKQGSPLIDAGIDIGLSYYGAAPDIGAYEAYPATPEEQVAALASSVTSSSPEVFRTPAEQRRKALYNQLMAVLNQLETLNHKATATVRKGVLTGIVSKLQYDILPKADGFFGGNPANDWITSPSEQKEFYPRVKQLIDTLKADIASLP